MTQRDWTAYYDAVAGKPPRETLVMALDAFEAEDSCSASLPVVRVALDLGCGEGRDTRELLRRDGPTRWTVHCSDATAQGVQRTIASLALADRARVRSSNAPLHETAAEWSRAHAGDPGLAHGPVDLANASFVLPFVAPEHFARVWAWIRSIIAPGGRFAGQFFGPRDSWASVPGRSHHTRQEVLGMLDGLAIEHFREDDKDGHDAEGNAKHWHVFHVVAHRVTGIQQPASYAAMNASRSSRST